MFLQRRILKIYMMKFNLFFEFVNFFLRDISATNFNCFYFFL